jgi:hypothetical protein
MMTKCWAAAGFIFFGVAACNPTSTPPPAGAGPTQTQILDPVMNQVLRLEPYTIQFDSTAQMGIESFEVAVNGSVFGSVAPLSSGSCGAGCGHSFFGEFVWNPPSTGHFILSVRAYGSGQWGEPGVVEVDVMEDTAAKASPPKLKSTSTPKVGLSDKVMVQTKENSNCREGGGENYRILAVVMKGEPAEAIAISEDGVYVKVVPQKIQVKCWIAIGLLEVLSGDPGLLPIEPFPPLPPESEPAKPPAGVP